MIIEALFGKPKPTSFDRSVIPGPGVKYSMGDAKKHLRQFLSDINYSDEPYDVGVALEMFSSFIQSYREDYKDTLIELREELKDEKEGLKEMKTEFSAFKKNKKNYLTTHELEDYEGEKADYEIEISEQKTIIDQANKRVDVQKTINAHLPEASKRILPVYANYLLKEGTFAHDLHIPIIEPVRVHLQYQNVKQQSTLESTQRTVDVDWFSADRFRGYCHLRKETRVFSFYGVLGYSIDGENTLGDPLLDCLLRNI